jgi:hypothetical protein
VNNDHNDNRDGPRRGNNYYGSSSRSGGRDSAEEMLDGGVQATPTSTKMECEDPLISSLSAGNFFASVDHFRRGCKRNSRWQVR